jgi:Tfp pilus assembly protein PilF
MNDEIKIERDLTLAINAKDIKRALFLAQTMNNNYPLNARGWYLASVALMAVHKDEAIKAIRKALEIDSENSDYILHIAKLFLSEKKKDECFKSLEKLLELPAIKSSLLIEVGMMHTHFKDYTGSLVVFERAVEIDGDNPQCQFNLASTYRFLGKYNKAQECLEKVIELNPSDYEARLMLSEIRTQTPERNHISALKFALDESSARSVSKVPLYYALAKEYEDVRNYEASFSYLSLGSTDKRQSMKYDVNTDIAIIDAICDTYDSSAFTAGIQGDESHSPIFIIGMPRTGTTLVERIVSNHMSVDGLGELNDFALELMGQVKDQGLKPTSRLDLIAKTKQLDFLKLGQAYLSAVDVFRKDGACFIDKLPFNYLYAGLIHLALPNAKIIHVQRHPMDTIYAIYKQLFKEAYPFSYDLSELARYYVAYDRLMRHWYKVMPGVIHPVSYENLVADLESEAKQLINYCDLPWQEGCLDFHNNKQASVTASASQIRHSVYSSSVGKWRYYDKHLTRVSEVIKQAGISVC